MTFTHVDYFVQFQYISSDSTHLMITIHQNNPIYLLSEQLLDTDFPRQEAEPDISNMSIEMYLDWEIRKLGLLSSSTLKK